MKFLIFDSGPLISLTLSGVLYVLEKLKTGGIHFILTPQVKKEVIDRAMTIKKYKLEAVKILDLLERGVLEESSKFIDNKELIKETINCINQSKKVISAGGEKINLIHEGEASCLAFSKLIREENLIIIDERTTRLITESAENMKILMEKKLHMKIEINKKNLEYFKEFRFIRSSELIFIAFEKGLVNLKKDVETLDALLYNLKFNGAAISSKEIEQMKEIFDGPRRN